MKTKMRLMAVMALFSAVLFTGCKKDEGSTPEFILTSKTYAAYAYQGGGWTGQPYFDVYWVFRFIDAKYVERTARENNYQGKIIGDIEKLLYKLEYPKIIFSKENGEVLYQGTFVDEKTMRTVGYQGSVTEYVLK